MKRFMLIALVSSAMFLSACTDAERAKLGAYGSPGSVKCYSGELLIYDGKSTGKILNESNSDGYYFKDAESGENVEVSGNCVI